MYKKFKHQDKKYILKVKIIKYQSKFQCSFYSTIGLINYSKFSILSSFFNYLWNKKYIFQGFKKCISKQTFKK